MPGTNKCLVCKAEFWINTPGVIKEIRYGAHTHIYIHYTGITRMQYTQFTHILHIFDTHVTRSRYEIACNIAQNPSFTHVKVHVTMAKQLPFMYHLRTSWRLCFSRLYSEPFWICSLASCRECCCKYFIGSSFLKAAYTGKQNSTNESLCLMYS